MSITSLTIMLLPDVLNKQVEVAPRAVGLFSLPRAVPAYYEDDIVPSTGTRSNTDGRESAQLGFLSQYLLILIW